MPTYNFTVRATDESGAYSDRNFAINVRNTIVDRYVVSKVGTTNNEVLTSTNTKSWTQRDGALPIALASSDSTNLARGMVYGNGRWLTWYSTTSGSPRYSLSTDGINWTQYTTFNIDGAEKSLTANKTIRINFIDGNFCAIAGFSTNGNVKAKLILSEDGVNWYTNDPTDAVANTGLNTSSHLDATFNLNKIEGVWYYSGYSISIHGYRSTDGITWTAYNPFPTGTLTTFTGWYYFNGLWIVPDQSSNARVFTSNDGVTWIARSIPLPSGLKPSQILYGNGRLVMTLRNTGTANANQHILTSEDGINWTLRTFPSYGAPSSASGTFGYATPCVYSNGLFVLGSQFVNATTGIGGLRVSADGINWTVQNEQDFGAIHSITAMDL